MRAVGLTLALGVVVLSGCSTAQSADSRTSAASGAPVPASNVQSVAGAWRGLMTGRELNSGSGSSTVPITLVITADGKWNATSGSERWTGTVRQVGDGFELDGTAGSARRPVALMLHRYGRDGLGGSVTMDYQGRRTSMTADLRAMPAPETASGDGSQPSASPPSGTNPPSFGGGAPPAPQFQAP
jgi:hypothetical protein